MSTTTTRIDNFIGGVFTASVAGATEAIVNPATGEVIADAPLSDASDGDAAVAAASGAFEGWSRTPPGERALALLRIADALEDTSTLAAGTPALDSGDRCPRTSCLTASMAEPGALGIPPLDDVRVLDDDAQHRDVAVLTQACLRHE